MSYVWFGLGLSLLVALGTLIFSPNAFARQQPLQYKAREDEDNQDTSTTTGNRSRRGSGNQPREEDTCIICLTEIVAAQKEFLPCFHFFHSKCIRNLMTYDRKCPICRTMF